MNIQENNNNPEKLKEDQNNIIESKINENNILTGLPSKLELDNKAIKSIMPFFEKNMNYTKKIAKNEENVIILYDQKIDELISLGYKPLDAIKEVAKIYNLDRKELYKDYVKDKNK